LRCSNKTIKHGFRAAYYYEKDQYTLIEQSAVAKYSNRIHGFVCKLGILQAKLGLSKNIEQNR